MAGPLQTSATADEVLREISRIKSAVSEAVDDGVRSALRASRQGREFAEDTIDDAKRVIRRNPLQAAGILFAAGIAIGGLVALLCRPRD